MKNQQSFEKKTTKSKKYSDCSFILTITSPHHFANYFIGYLLLIEKRFVILPHNQRNICNYDMKKVLLHHTCKQDGGEEYVLKNAPFFANFNSQDQVIIFGKMIQSKPTIGVKNTITTNIILLLLNVRLMKPLFQIQIVRKEKRYSLIYKSFLKQKELIET